MLVRVSFLLQIIPKYIESVPEYIDFVPKYIDLVPEYIESVPKYIECFLISRMITVLLPKKKRQKEKTTRSNPWPHRRQLQLDERFGCIQPTVRKQRVASRCYTSFSETRQCLLTRQWWRRIWVTQLAVDINSRRWSFRTWPSPISRTLHSV